MQTHRACTCRARLRVIILLSGVASLVLAGPASADCNRLRGFWAAVFHPGFKSTAAINDMVARAAEGHYNAILAEVMAYQDNATNSHGAYWNSSIVPKAPDIEFGLDPLLYLCQRAHAQNPPIEVHAWLMPYRVCLGSDPIPPFQPNVTGWPPTGNSTIPADGSWLMTSQANMELGPRTFDGSQFWLDPGSPDVQEYLVSIVRELVSNYEIDGIHWDYELSGTGQRENWYPCVDTDVYLLSGLARYFRLYSTSTVPAPGDGNWCEFHRRSTEELLRRCQAEIASIKSNPRQPLRHTASLMVYGSAPSCGNFTASSAYLNYQNWPLHLQQGWIDAGVPMNYKDVDCSGQEAMYESWINQINACGWKGSRHVYMGQANYQNTFTNSIAQMQYADSHSMNGTVNYVYYYTRGVSSTCDDGPAVDWNWYPTVGAALPLCDLPSMPWKQPTASEGILWGRVLNWAGGYPIDNATVKALQMTQDCGSVSPPPVVVTTDGNGYYVFAIMSTSSHYKLCAIANGVGTAIEPEAIVQRGDVVRYDFDIGAPPAELSVAPLSFTRTVAVGNNLASDSFTVDNVGVAPLNYNISENSNWLSVTPNNGVCRSNVDSITINYTTGGLALGSYVANIPVADAAATGSPQTVTVNLTVKVPGDFNGDYDVDQEDFGGFQKCFSGTSPTPPGCADANLDGNNRVNEADFAKFHNCMYGPGVVPPIGCAN